MSFGLYSFGRASYGSVPFVASGKVDYTLPCAAGAYSLAANAATLTYVPGAGAVAYVLTCDAGAYVVTGQAATFNYARSMVAAAGAYAISIKTAGLSFNRKLSVTSAAYAIASKAAALTYTAGNATQNYIFSAAVRVYVITSGSATLNFSSITNYANAPSGITYHRDFVNSKRESISNSARPAFKNTMRH